MLGGFFTGVLSGLAVSASVLALGVAVARMSVDPGPEAPQPVVGEASTDPLIATEPGPLLDVPEAVSDAVVVNDEPAAPSPIDDETVAQLLSELEGVAQQPGIVPDTDPNAQELAPAPATEGTPVFDEPADAAGPDVSSRTPEQPEGTVDPNLALDDEVTEPGRLVVSSTPFTERDDAVPVNRTVDTTTLDAETGAEEATGTDQRPALVRHGAPFSGPADAAMISIVILDDPALADGPVVLAGLPFPVTVAVDPTSEGIAERVAAYADAGLEVALISTVPAGAEAGDAAVTLGASIDIVPSAVALVDLGGGGLQGSSEAAGVVIDQLAADGRGFLSVSQGLNTPMRVAEQAGVPATLIYRDLDADETDQTRMRRFLDQAAFRARQESGVVLLARLQPDTIRALDFWAQSSTARTVATAPLSAVLLDLGDGL